MVKFSSQDVTLQGGVFTKKDEKMTVINPLFVFFLNLFIDFSLKPFIEHWCVYLPKKLINLKGFVLITH